LALNITGLGNDEPLVVSPKRAQYLLGCGNTRFYELLTSGELESYKDGKSRKITMRSIRARVERKLAEAGPETSPITKVTAARIKRRTQSETPPTP
jgi:hypothetical protein